MNNRTLAMALIMALIVLSMAFPAIANGMVMYGSTYAVYLAIRALLEDHRR